MPGLLARDLGGWEDSHENGPNGWFGSFSLHPLEWTVLGRFLCVGQLAANFGNVIQHK